MSDVYLAQVATSLIDSPTIQPRQLLGPLDDLIDSMMQSGFLSSLLVEQQPNGRYTLLHGARRLAAARQLGELELPALICPAGHLTAAQVWLSQINENERRRNLTNMEKALAYQQQKLLFDYEELCRLLACPLPTRTDITEADYEMLAAEARADGLRGIKPRSWPRVEQLVGISETQRKKLLRLTRLPTTLQQAMLSSPLALDALHAISEAPADCQLELLQAASTGDGYHSKVVQIVARILHEAPMGSTISELLAQAEAERVSSRGLSVQAVADKLRGLTTAMSLPVKSQATNLPRLVAHDAEPSVAAPVAEGSPATARAQLEQQLTELRRSVRQSVRLLEGSDEAVAAGQMLHELATWLLRQEAKLKPKLQKAKGSQSDPLPVEG